MAIKTIVHCVCVCVCVCVCCVCLCVGGFPLSSNRCFSVEVRHTSSVFGLNVRLKKKDGFKSFNNGVSAPLEEDKWLLSLNLRVARYQHFVSVVFG